MGVIFLLSFLCLASLSCIIGNTHIRNSAVAIFSAIAFLCAVKFVVPGSYELNIFGHLVRVYSVDKFSLFILQGLVGIVLLLSTCRHGSGRSELGLCLAVSCAGAWTLIAGDLISAAIAHELFAISGCVLVGVSCRADDRKVALQYMLFQALAGVLFVAGVAFRIADYGSADFMHEQLTFIDVHNDIGSYLIFGSLFITCALFPFHSWLINAYSGISVFPRLFLQSFNIGIGVFSLFHMFEGTKLLLFCAALTAIYSAISVLVERNIRRISAYNVVAQTSVILMSVGMAKEPIMQIGISMQIVFCMVYQILFALSVHGIVTYSNNTDIQKLKFGFTDAHLVLLIIILLHGGFPVNLFEVVQPGSILPWIHNNTLLYIVGILVFWAIHVRVFCYSSFFALEHAYERPKKIMNFQVFIFLFLLCGGMLLSLSDSSGFINYLFKTDLYTPGLTVKGIFYSIGLLIPAVAIVRFFPGVAFVNMDVDWGYRVFLPYIYELTTKFVKFITRLFAERILILFGMAENVIQYFCIEFSSSVRFSMTMFIGVLLVGLCLVL